jgi:glycosyltransferase involved in cell wall biosynthesis
VRILVATDVWFPDYAGGSARVAAETAARLAARGHEVTVLAPRAPGRPGEASERDVTVLRTLGRSRAPRSMTDVVSTVRHARQLRRARFDVAIGHQPTTTCGLLMAGLESPVVSVFHASGAREARLLGASLPHGPARWAARGLDPWLAALERQAFARVDRVLTLSEYSASLVAADHPAAAGRVRVLRGGVDVDRFRPAAGARHADRAAVGLDPERMVILMVRRLGHRLGLEEAFRAVATLRDARDFVVAVVGIGPLAGRLRELASALGMGERVLFVGRPDEKALRTWYRAADVFVLPPARHEGFGLATIEALASGTPAVGGAAGATPELLRDLDPRLVARDASSAALADAIAYALDAAGPELRLRCRRYACERFSWERAIEEWESALETVAARPSVARAA